MNLPTSFLGWVSLIWENYSGMFLYGTQITLVIAITGTIGILLQAYDEQYMNVSDVEECLMILKTSGIRISESLYNLVRQHIYNSQQ